MEPQATKYETKSTDTCTTQNLWVRLASPQACHTHVVCMIAGLAHWSSMPCALQDMYTVVVWTDEALFYDMPHHCGHWRSHSMWWV